MSNPLQELNNAVDTLGGGVSELLDSVGKSLDSIISNPLPIIETVALTYALGPAYGGLSATTAPIVASAAVSAANGGNIENIALAAATAYAGAQIGQTVGNQFAPTVEKIDPAFSDQALVQRVVTSASGAAATTALRGGSFDQVLTSAVSASVAPMVNQQLANQGYDPKGLPANLIANATSAATRAVLSGQSISDAVVSSAAVTALTAGISTAVNSLKGNQDTLTQQAADLQKKSQEANDFFTNNLDPLQKQADQKYQDLQNLQKDYQTQYSIYKSAYDNYNNYAAGAKSSAADIGSWYAQNGYSLDNVSKSVWGTYRPDGSFDLGPSHNDLVNSANQYAKTVNDLTPIIQALSDKYNSAKTDYQTFASTVTNAQDNYKSMVTDLQNSAANVQKLTDTVNTQAKDVGEKVAQYNDTVNSVAGNYAQKIGNETVNQAQNLLQTTAKDAGFPDWSTYSQNNGDLNSWVKNIVSQNEASFKTPDISKETAMSLAAQDADAKGLTGSDKLNQILQAGGYTKPDTLLAQAGMSGADVARMGPAAAAAMLAFPEVVLPMLGVLGAAGLYDLANKSGALDQLNSYWQNVTGQNFTPSSSEQQLPESLRNLVPTGAGAGRGTVNPPTVTPTPVTPAPVTTPTTTPTQPDYQVKPGDYTDTTEQVQPWQNTGQPTAITNEEQIVKFLQDQGISPTPELVTSIAKDAGVNLSDPVTTASTNALAQPIEIATNKSKTTTPAPAPSPAPTPTPIPTPTPDQTATTTPAPTTTPTGLTSNDVQKIVSDALASNPSLTSEQVQTIVNQAIASNPSLTSDQVKGIVNQSIASSGLASTSQVTDLKNELTQAINQAVAQGKTGDAALQAGIDAVASSVGATKDQLLQQMGKSQDQLKQDFAAQIGGVQQQIGGVQDALTKAINDAKAQGLQGDQVLQSAINKVAGDLGTTKTDLLNRLGTTESQLRTDFSSQIGGVQSQIAGVQDALTKAIEDAKASGLAGDAALQAGINTVANSVGTTKADLLAQMGKTEADLRTDFANQIGGVQSQIGTVQDSLTKAIADAKAQGLQGDAVLQSAINKVAGDLGTTKTDLLNKIGTTEADLKTQFASQIGGVQEQIGTVQDALTKAINDAKAQGLQGDQALQAGIDAVAKSVGTTKADLLTQMGTTEQALRDLYAKGQQQTSADIANVQKSLTDQIASNEAAGLSRDAATQKAIQDVATNLGTTKDLLLAQIGQTAQSLQDEYTTGQLQTQTQIAGVQKSLQDQLAASDEATKAAFAKADAATQQEIANRVAQGQQLQDAIAASQAATTQQITGVQSSLESQLNTQGKAFLDALRQQGVDYNTALKETVDAQNTAFAGYQASTEKALQNLDQSSQDKFNILTTAQQQQALQLAQRTGDLQGSIDAVASTVAANQGQTQEQLDAIRQAQAQAAADQAARDQATADAMAAQNAALTGQITGLQASQTAYQKAQAAAQAKAQNQATQQSALSALAGASPTAPQTSGKSGFLSPLTATFLTAAATPSKFVNPLESLEAIINPRENPKQQPEGSPMASYYNYGSTSSIEDVLGSTPSGQAQNFGGLQYPQFMASGGMATPLMASGGFAGTRHGHYAHGGLSTPLVASGGKMRVDFRHGDAVSGEGDGQSDDIPAMLADGEFVFPADVVAAIGNGSTKAGSDKLYDMMHSIRSHVRSAKPKDLPPEIKSPLDFLSKRRSK